MSSLRGACLLIAGVLVRPGHAPALTAQTAPSGPPTCDAPEHRQLDFWVGSWDVTMRGKEAGTNVVTREESGCLIT